ncbi:MAG: hypothetical protein ABJP34_01175 [Erythrobacter sp.]
MTTVILHQHADLGAEQVDEFTVYVIHKHRNARMYGQVHCKDQN